MSVLMLPGVDAAQAQTPPAPEAPGTTAPIPIRRPAPASQPARTSASDDGLPTWRVVSALAVVVGLIFVLRWLSRRVTGQAGGGRSRAIQVVSRSMVGPRQQLMLVHVGRRLVLVGQTGSTMSPLCQIDDPEELAQVLGQVQQEKSESISRAFAGLFRREEEKFAEAESGPRLAESDDEPTDLDPDGTVGTTKQELHELLDKVRDMTSAFRK